MIAAAKIGAADSRYEQAARFLNFLFYGLSRGYVEFRFTDGSPRRKPTRKPAFYALPVNAAQAAREALGEGGGANVFFGPAPRYRVPTSKGPAADEDVLMTTCLWVDLDYRRAEGGAVEAIRRAEEFPLRPSAVVDSDFGRQLYFVFNEPATAGRLLAWDRSMRSLAELFGAGGDVRPSSVLPLPGSDHAQDGAAAAPALVSEADSAWLRYGLEELEGPLRRQLELRRANQRRAGAPKEKKVEGAAAARAATDGGPGEESGRCPSERGPAKGVVANALPPSYERDADGSVWFRPQPSDSDRRPPRPVKVSNSYLRIARVQEDVESGEISFAIEFDYLGRVRSAVISRSQMADARRLVTALAGGGAPVTSNNARAVVSYLTAYEHAFGAVVPRAKVTGRFGRLREDGPFYLPGATDAVEFRPALYGDAAVYRALSSRRGSLQGWAEMMRQIAGEDFYVPQAAVLAALVPPLQARLQIPNFILDINGNSSTGKSTSLKLAASVYGRPSDPDSLVMQWMNTRLAVEHVAGLCSGLPIFLDDAQHCPAELKRSLVYLIANGRGKGRVARGTGVRETPSWHTVALSTSEEPLHRASPHEGARGRILSIGGATPPFPSGMSSFVQALEREAAENHGHPGELYVRHLNGWADSAWEAWRQRYWAARQELFRGGSSNLVDRVSGYVAAVQVAGEIARKLFGLPFDPAAVARWLMGHVAEDEAAQNYVALALGAMADHYVKNVRHFAGDGRHNSDRSAAVHGAAKTNEFVGFLASTVDAIFRRHNLDRYTVLNRMAEAGLLHATENYRHTKKVGVGGLKHRMVCVKWSALFPEDTGAGRPA
jgi:hypothetical protein